MLDVEGTSRSRASFLVLQAWEQASQWQGSIGSRASGWLDHLISTQTVVFLLVHLFIDESCLQRICTNSTGGPQPQGHTSPSVLTLADRGLHSGAFVGAWAPLGAWAGAWARTGAAATAWGLFWALAMNFGQQSLRPLTIQESPSPCSYSSSKHTVPSDISQALFLLVINRNT